MEDASYHQETNILLLLNIKSEKYILMKLILPLYITKTKYTT